MSVRKRAAAYAAATIEVTPMARLFKALGDDVRLRIVALLAHGELCVCHIEEALRLTQPNASRHLAILRAAGVVTHRRRDKWVHYRLATQADRDCRRHLQGLVAAFARNRVLDRDVRRLRKQTGPDACA
jgi:ArsR family transcriptional regulator